MTGSVYAALHTTCGKFPLPRPRNGDSLLRLPARYHKACAPVYAPLARRPWNTPPHGMSAGRAPGAAVTGERPERDTCMAAEAGALCHD